MDGVIVLEDADTQIPSHGSTKSILRGRTYNDQFQIFITCIPHIRRIVQEVQKRSTRSYVA